MEEGFSPRKLISKQKSFLHLIICDRKSPHPFALNISLQANVASRESLPPLSPMTANYFLVIVISLQMVSLFLFLSAGAEGESDICILWGRGIHRTLLEKVSEGLPEEISASLPHCRLAQWFKQLRVILPQQTAVNAHCQYVPINISGEPDTDITVHASSQAHCVLFPSSSSSLDFFL